MIRYITLFSSLLLLSTGCSEAPAPVETTPIATPVVLRPSGNPNGDTELALLMRDLFDVHMQMRKALAKGEKPDLPLEVERLHTAEATQPEKVETPLYDSLADAYIYAVKAYREAPLEEAPKAYNLMVARCLSCHQPICPGPMPKIKKLMLPGE